MKVNDLMLYLVGTGEYDELMRASPLDSLPASTFHYQHAAGIIARAMQTNLWWHREPCCRPPVL